MNKRRFADVEAYQHADDGYYYRPLVAGKELFSYVAHVPAGGYMPPDAEEAELFELSLFMLEGELEGILNEDRIKLEPGDALHIPRGTPFGHLSMDTMGTCMHGLSGVLGLLPRF